MKYAKRWMVVFLVVLAALSSTTVSAEGTGTALAFSDVAADSVYAEPIAWAVEHEITNGTTPTTFSPNTTCTKAQVLTFLWRACGSPDSAGDNPFSDVTGEKFYTKAALWAYRSGLVESGLFQPDQPCSRNMAIEYLWKEAGSPKSSVPVSFSDVNGTANNTDAIAWALEAEVTAGTGDGTTFSPGKTCTRAQIITFLYRGLAEQLKPDAIHEYIEINL